MYGIIFKFRTIKADEKFLSFIIFFRCKDKKVVLWIQRLACFLHA